MFASIRSLLQDRRGISAVEYGVLGAGIVLVITAGITTLAGGINGLFGQLAAALN